MQKPESGASVLAAAIAAGAHTKAVVQSLLGLGADPSLADGEGTTPFHLVAASGDSTLLAAVSASIGDAAQLTRLANMQRSSDRATPLHIAAAAGHLQAVKALLAVPYNSDMLSQRADGSRALHLLAAHEAALKPLGIVLPKWTSLGVDVGLPNPAAGNIPDHHALLLPAKERQPWTRAAPHNWLVLDTQAMATEASPLMHARRVSGLDVLFHPQQAARPSRPYKVDVLAGDKPDGEFFEVLMGHVLALPEALLKGAKMDWLKLPMPNSGFIGRCACSGASACACACVQPQRLVHVRRLATRGTQHRP